MSAVEALKAARIAGIHINIEGNDLVLEAPAPPCQRGGAPASRPQRPAGVRRNRCSEQGAGGGEGVGGPRAITAHRV
jgi:hypothetical protein